MKKKIVILGSTGSVGKNTFKLILKDKKNFEIKLLSANKNISSLLKQAKIFKVKHLIINDKTKYLLAKKKFKNLDIKFYNSFKVIDHLFNKKEIDYSMVSISGINGLTPSIKLIKYSKNIAIVNKESLICGWELINKQLKKNKTNFYPIDSEHYSIFSLIDNSSNIKIEKIYITASGGPFLNYKLSDLKRASLIKALKHPNWKMGKKITIDSSTLMNKVFEVIEAKNIFDLKYKDIIVLSHPKSYVHAIVKFNNGISKFLLHDADMKIPIHNSLYSGQNKPYKSKQINFDVINNLNFKTIDGKKFPLINIIKNLPQKNSLYETALITINDYFVDKFLNKKIDYLSLVNSVYEYSNLRMFTKLKKFPVNTVSDVYKTKRFVNFQLSKLGV